MLKSKKEISYPLFSKVFNKTINNPFIINSLTIQNLSYHLLKFKKDYIKNEIYKNNIDNRKNCIIKLSRKVNDDTIFNLISDKKKTRNFLNKFSHSHNSAKLLIANKNSFSNIKKKINHSTISMDSSKRSDIKDKYKIIETKSAKNFKLRSSKIRAIEIDDLNIIVKNRYDYEEMIRNRNKNLKKNKIRKKIKNDDMINIGNFSISQKEICEYLNSTKLNLHSKNKLVNDNKREDIFNSLSKNKNTNKRKSRNVVPMSILDNAFILDNIKQYVNEIDYKRVKYIKRASFLNKNKRYYINELNKIRYNIIKNNKNI